MESLRQKKQSISLIFLYWSMEISMSRWINERIAPFRWAKIMVKGKNETRKWYGNEWVRSFRNENYSNGYKWISKAINEIKSSLKTGESKLVMEKMVLRSLPRGCAERKNKNCGRSVRKDGVK